MKLARFAGFCSAASTAVLVSLAAAFLAAPTAFAAGELQFRRPSVQASSKSNGVEFRRFKPGTDAPTPALESNEQPVDASPGGAVAKAAAAQRTPQSPASIPMPVKLSQAEARRAPEARPLKTAAVPPASDRPLPQYVVDRPTTGQTRRVRPAQHMETIEPMPVIEHGPSCSCVDCIGGYEPQCGICEAVCGCAEPICGIAEPACGIMEPGCGIMEPGCGIVEPGCAYEDPACGIADPDCGMVGCGSCVANPGPDYWCFPVCLPRLKELSFWAGAHGFKGPRDYINNGPGDNNFGFQEGVNLGGRAPLVGFVFPQLSYQLGYQAVQSRLSGSPTSTDDRSQQFVTAGLFRRVPSGLQFGCVFDLMRDDFVIEEDFHQLRYEVSLKSGNGPEIGFWGASNTNSILIGGTEFQTVDQYNLFFRWNFPYGGTGRVWGGGTSANEGVVGADFSVPLNDRWSIQTGFNYLIPDAPEGPIGAQEESWNVGLNLVWHWGCNARKGRCNPHAPLFPVADNGWMFIDQAN